MSLTIIKAGILDTIQDMGRYGFQHEGINPTGAMDKYALQVTNMLVGNEPGEPVIELHFPASVFLFGQPALIALGGADLSASINGEAVPVLHLIIVNKNDVLQFHKPDKGARAYLAVAGGFVSEEWLGSCSTNLKANAGGYKGRSLQKNDELILKKQSPFTSIIQEKEFSVLPWHADIEWGDNNKDILVLPGNEWERLSPHSKEFFFNEHFIIAPQSDRMGYRLNNIQMETNSAEEIVSSAVNFGTVQLLPDGSLIILMADHQTTGGYPRVAHVITAHHSKLAQLKAGDNFKFRLTDQLTSEELLAKQTMHLLQLQNACTFRLEEYLYAGKH